MPYALIKNFSSDSTGNSEKDQIGRELRNDVVEIRLDSFVGWGTDECLPKLLIIKLTGITFEAAQALAAEKIELLTDLITGAKSWETLKKRPLFFDIDKHISKTKQKEIKESDWLVLDFDKAKLEQK